MWTPTFARHWRRWTSWHCMTTMMWCCLRVSLSSSPATHLRQALAKLPHSTNQLLITHTLSRSCSLRIACKALYVIRLEACHQALTHTPTHPPQMRSSFGGQKFWQGATQRRIKRGLPAREWRWILSDLRASAPKRPPPAILGASRRLAAANKAADAQDSREARRAQRAHASKLKALEGSRDSDSDGGEEVWGDQGKHRASPQHTLPSMAAADGDLTDEDPPQR